MPGLWQLIDGAWDKISHLFAGIPPEDLFWAVLTFAVIVSVAWSLTNNTQG